MLSIQSDAEMTNGDNLTRSFGAESSSSFRNAYQNRLAKYRGELIIHNGFENKLSQGVICFNNHIGSALLSRGNYFTLIVLIFC